MARVELPVVVKNATTGLPVPACSILISQRATGVPVTWYTTETGSTASTSPVVTDANGRATAWVARGAYTLTFSGTGITTSSQPWDAMPGSDLGGDTLWLPDGAVTNAKVATGVDAAKFTTGAVPASRIGSLSVPGSALQAGAVTAAARAVGNGSRLLYAAVMNTNTAVPPPGFGGSSTQHGPVNVTHSAKPCWAVAVQHLRATSGSGGMQMWLGMDTFGYGNSPIWYWSTTPDNAMLTSYYYFSSMTAGTHSWKVGIDPWPYLGVSGTAAIDGTGIFMIFEQN